MTWVKVCGLRDRAMVEHAVQQGADAVGAVLLDLSPRSVPVEQAAEMFAEIPIQTVILTLDIEPDVAIELLRHTGATTIQPYGFHSAAVVTEALHGGYKVLHPLKATTDLVLPDADGSMPLLDTPHTTMHGGTGTRFDWSIAAAIDRDFVLAGGLNPDNVAEAVTTTNPWGVDASSGLEMEVGVKDPGKVAAFIHNAKAATREITP